MRTPSPPRTGLLLLAPLFLCIVSCLVFACERISNTLLTTHLYRDLHYGFRTLTLYGPNKTNTPPEDYDFIDVDISLSLGPTFAIVAIACFAFLVSAIAACAVWELGKASGSPRYQRGWSWFMLVANLMAVGASVGVLAWTSSVQGKEGWRGYEDVGKPDQKWTKETWLCQIDHFFPMQDWAGSACSLSKATRFMLVAVAVAAVVIMVSTWTLIHQRGGVGWLFGGEGRYAGFSNMYEMGPPQAPGVYPPAHVYPQGPVYPQGQLHPHPHATVYGQTPIPPQSPGYYQPQGPWPQSPGFQPQAPGPQHAGFQLQAPGLQATQPSIPTNLGAAKPTFR